MSKPKPIQVVIHSHPSSQELADLVSKYESQGFEVFVFTPLRPRSFQGWSLDLMLNEIKKLEYFVSRAKVMAFNGMARLHAKHELKTLYSLTLESIPAKVFKDLPIVARGHKNRTYYVRQPKTN